MPRTCRAYPVLPGHRDVAHGFLSALATERSRDFAAFGERAGLRRCDWYLADGVGGEQIIVYLEGESPSDAIDRLMHSRSPFELWLRARLVEATGFDLNDPPEGILPTELLASLPAGDERALT